MITCLIISFLVYKLFGNNNPFKKSAVKAPVCDSARRNGPVTK